MTINRGEFSVQINGNDVLLKVSMWVMDENRWSDLANQKPNSVLWQGASQFYTCYLNACRVYKKPVELTMDDFVNWFDELTSYEPEKVADITGIMVGEIEKLTANQKKMKVTGNPGQTSEPTPSGNLT